jgi:O-methyltransferase domain
LSPLSSGGSSWAEHSLSTRAVHSQVLAQLPEYFQKHGYKNPTDIEAGPFQFAMGYQGTYFEWLKANPIQQETFNRMMALTRLERGQQWFEFFPTEERFGATDPSQVVLVDIGGGLGHDLAAFHAHFPNLPGKLVLQDLPGVINNIQELSPAIQRTVHDFFTPQPIKGARAYYLRTVLHDFPDKQSIQILKTIREAMTSESVLLLNENFLPEKDVPLYNAEIDFSMLALFSSMERTKKEWIALLEAAGLEVVKVWEPEDQLVASGTLFEAVRKD